MKSSYSIPIICFLLLSTFLVSCKSGPKSLEGMEAIKQHVAILAHDSMEGRETGQAGEIMAAKYIQSQMELIGLEPYKNDSYLQLFSKKELNNPHAAADAPENAGSKSIEGRNVVGRINNGAEKTIVIGGHYDHLGFGDEGSLHRGEPAIHNGADDNASGISILLELARRCNELGDKHNYLFVAFSGEEKGLWGSNFFCKAAEPEEIEDWMCMINMDMIGRLDEEKKLAINGTGTAAEWNSLIDELNASYNFSLVKKPSGVGPSDHTSFYLVDVPVLQFFTGAHEDYHRPEDDIEKINWEGLEAIGNYIFGIIEELQDEDDLDFQKTKNESDDTPKFKVTLGVVPDYMFDGAGMRIDGVSDGRPAANAGMVKGDVVVAMGGMEVADMNGYMKALSKFKVGDATEVVIDRDGEKKTFQITFDK